MNKIRIVGEISTNINHYYDYNGESFYFIKISCKRSSGATDTLPVVMSQYVAGEVRAGDTVEVVGEVRSRNNNGKVDIFIFAQGINLYNSCDINEVRLEGNICKLPIYRLTPLGREITDIILAVKRLHSTDFLPCIAWGRLAKYSSKLNIGDRIELIGRLQSREHRKGVAYEVSVNQIKYNGGA